MLDSFVLIFRDLCRAPSVTAHAVPPPSRREAFRHRHVKGSLLEGAVAVRRLGELPKIFLHQCFFQQLQFLKTLLYGLLLLVNSLYKSGKHSLVFQFRNANFNLL